MSQASEVSSVSASLTQVLLADSQLRVGQIEQSRASLSLAFQLLGPDAEVCPSLWLVQGRLCMRLGRLDEAMDALDRSLLLYGRDEDPAGQANCRLVLGELHRLEGRRLRAQRQLELAWELALASGELALQGAVLASLGALELQHLDLPQAEELYDEALRIARAAGDWELVAQILLGLGEVYSRLGQARAVDTLLEGARVLARRGQRHALAGALLRVADHALRHRHLDLALVAGLAATSLWAESGSWRGVGLALRVVVKALAALRLGEEVLLAASLRARLAGGIFPRARDVRRFYEDRAPSGVVSQLRTMDATTLHQVLWVRLTPRLATLLQPLGMAPRELSTPHGALEVVCGLVSRLDPESLSSQSPSHARGERATPWA